MDLEKHPNICMKEFNSDWLKPKEGDIHSKTYSQSKFLNYLVDCRRRLARQNADLQLESVFLNTLKVLTSLEVCQATPIRLELSFLWSESLKRSPNSIISCARWFIDQISVFMDKDSLPQQAIVFIQCSFSVFKTFIDIIPSLFSEWIMKLVNICKNLDSHNVPPSILILDILSEMITIGHSLLSKALGSTIYHKICSQFIKSEIFCVQESVFSLTSSLWTHGLIDFGLIEKKRLKYRAFEIYEAASKIKHESSSKIQLNNFIGLLFTWNGTMLNDQLKTLESFIKFSNTKTEFPLEILLSVFRQSIICSHNDSVVETCLGLFSTLLQPFNLSSAIIPEKNQNIWCLDPTHVNHILAFLMESLSLKDFTQLLETILNNHVKFTPYSEEILYFYLQNFIFIKKQSTLEAISCFINFLQKYFLHSRPAWLVKELENAIAKRGENDSEFIFSLQISTFALLKESVLLLRHGDMSVSIDFIKTLSILLSRTLSMRTTCDPFSDLFYSDSLISSLLDWLRETFIYPEYKDTVLIIYSGLWSRDIHFESEFIDDYVISKCPPLPGLGLDDAFLRYSHELLSEKSKVPLTVKIEYVDKISDRLIDEWKMISASSSFNMMLEEIDYTTFIILSDVTLSCKSHFQLLQIAAIFCARLLCESSKKMKIPVIIAAQKIVAEYLIKSPLSSIKYHLSQFRVYIGNQTTAILQVIEKLLSKLVVGEGEEKTWIVEISKQIIFPLVCINSQAISALKSLSNFVGSKDYNDSVIRELIDGSLKEVNMYWRHRYIWALAHIFSMTQNTMETKLIIGLLCSLAKDSRSLSTQASAIEAIHIILQSQSQKIDQIIIEDLIYFCWQIFVHDHNVGGDKFDSPQKLYGSISNLMSVLIELNGPDISSKPHKQTSLICTLVGNFFLEYPSNASSLRIATQLLLINRKIEPIEVMEPLISLFSKTESSSVITFIKWLVKFQQFKFDSKFIASLLLISDSKGQNNVHSRGEVGYIISNLFKNTFQTQTADWLIHCDNPIILNLVCEHFNNVDYRNTRDSSIYSDILNSLVKIIMTSLQEGDRTQKLSCIRCISTIIKMVGPIKDSNGFIIEPFTHQILTILSMAASDPDMIIVSCTLANIEKLISAIDETNPILIHDKFKQFQKKSLEIIQDTQDHFWLTLRIELYAKINILSSIKDYHLMKAHLSLFQKAFLEYRDGHSFPLISNMLPSITNFENIKDPSLSIAVFCVLLDIPTDIKLFIAYVNGPLFSLIPNEIKSLETIEAFLFRHSSINAPAVAHFLAEATIVNDSNFNLQELVPALVCEYLLADQLYKSQDCLWLFKALGHLSLLDKYWKPLFQILLKRKKALESSKLSIDLNDPQTVSQMICILLESEQAIASINNLLFPKYLQIATQCASSSGKLPLSFKAQFVTELRSMMVREPTKAGPIWAQLFRNSHSREISIGCIDLILSELVDVGIFKLDSSKIINSIEDQTLSKLIIRFLTICN